MADSLVTKLHPAPLLVFSPLRKMVPVCGACSRKRRGTPNCTYQPERGTDAVSISYVKNLKSRIHQLESSLYKAKGVEQPSKKTKVSNLRHDIGFSPTTHTWEYSQDHLPNADQQKSPPESVVRDVTLLSPDSTLLNRECQRHQDVDDIQEDDGNRESSQGFLSEGNDGMGNTGPSAASFSFRSSSAASFMTQVRHAVSAKSKWGDMKFNEDSRSLDRRTVGSDTSTTFVPRHITEHCVLPARRTADQMLDIYWVQIHILYPFLHREQFLEAYHNLWISEGSKSDSRVVYCILNTVFALACRVTKRINVDEQEASAEVYFRRAVQLLQVDIIGAGSLGQIQALLLISQYLQSSEWPHRCWAAVGLAVRVAQGLGLHLPETTAELKCQRDRELARRLWHGCVFMDRMTAMTLGRPVMISRDDALVVPLPSSIDDQFLCLTQDKDASQPPNRPSTIAFFVHSVELFFITERILTTMYSSTGGYGPFNKPGASFPDQLASLDFSEILRLDGSLIKWDASLPSFLKYRATTPLGTRVDPIFPRQANILRLRYLHLQILLFRPLLSLLLLSEFRTTSSQDDSATRSWLPHAMALPCAKKCVFAAQQVIDLVHDNQNAENDNSVEPLPVWWYKVFFTYTSATALIPARMHTHIRGDISTASLLTSWERALGILRPLSRLSTSAERCLAALELINDKLLQERKQRRKEDCNGNPPPAQQKGRATHQQVSESSQLAAIQKSCPDFSRRLSRNPTISIDPNTFQPGHPMGPSNYETLFPSFPPGDWDSEQDTTWLDSLPTDLNIWNLGYGYGDISNIYSF